MSYTPEQIQQQNNRFAQALANREISQAQYDQAMKAQSANMAQAIQQKQQRNLQTSNQGESLSQTQGGTLPPPQQQASPLPPEPGTPNYVVQQLPSGQVLVQQGSKVEPIRNQAQQTVGYNITPPRPFPEQLGAVQNQALEEAKQQQLTNEYSQYNPQIGGTRNPLTNQLITTGETKTGPLGIEVPVARNPTQQQITVRLTPEQQQQFSEWKQERINTSMTDLGLTLGAAVAAPIAGPVAAVTGAMLGVSISEGMRFIPSNPITGEYRGSFGTPQEMYREALSGVVFTGGGKALLSGLGYVAGTQMNVVGKTAAYAAWTAPGRVSLFTGVGAVVGGATEGTLEGAGRGALFGFGFSVAGEVAAKVSPKVARVPEKIQNKIIDANVDRLAMIDESYQQSRINYQKFKPSLGEKLLMKATGLKPVTPSKGIVELPNTPTTDVWSKYQQERVIDYNIPIVKNGKPVGYQKEHQLIESDFITDIGKDAFSAEMLRSKTLEIAGLADSGTTLQGRSLSPEQYYPVKPDGTLNYKATPTLLTGSFNRSPAIDKKYSYSKQGTDFGEPQEYYPNDPLPKTNLAFDKQTQVAFTKDYAFNKQTGKNLMTGDLAPQEIGLTPLSRNVKATEVWQQPKNEILNPKQNELSFSKRGSGKYYNPNEIPTNKMIDLSIQNKNYPNDVLTGNITPDQAAKPKNYVWQETKGITDLIATDSKQLAKQINNRNIAFKETTDIGLKMATDAQKKYGIAKPNVEVVADNPRVGSYIPSTQTIKLSAYEKLMYAEQTAAHETGHHIHATLSQSVKGRNLLKTKGLSPYTAPPTTVKQVIGQEKTANIFGKTLSMSLRAKASYNKNSEEALNTYIENPKKIQRYINKFIDKPTGTKGAAKKVKPQQTINTSAPLPIAKQSTNTRSYYPQTYVQMQEEEIFLSTPNSGLMHPQQPKSIVDTTQKQNQTPFFGFGQAQNNPLLLQEQTLNVLDIAPTINQRPIIDTGISQAQLLKQDIFQKTVITQKQQPLYRQDTTPINVFPEINKASYGKPFLSLPSGSKYEGSGYSYNPIKIGGLQSRKRLWPILSGEDVLEL